MVDVGKCPAVMFKRAGFEANGLQRGKPPDWPLGEDWSNIQRQGICGGVLIFRERIPSSWFVSPSSPRRRWFETSVLDSCSFSLLLLLSSSLFPLPRHLLSFLLFFFFVLSSITFLALFLMSVFLLSPHLVFLLPPAVHPISLPPLLPLFFFFLSHLLSSSPFSSHVFFSSMSGTLHLYSSTLPYSSPLLPPSFRAFFTSVQCLSS